MELSHIKQDRPHIHVHAFQGRTPVLDPPPSIRVQTLRLDFSRSKLMACLALCTAFDLTWYATQAGLLMFL